MTVRLLGFGNDDSPLANTAGGSHQLLMQFEGLQGDAGTHAALTWFEGLQGDAGTHAALHSGCFSHSCAQAESEGAPFLLHTVCTAWLAKSHLSAAATVSSTGMLPLGV